MKATWLMVLVAYAATVLSIWWICMRRAVRIATLRGMQRANWGIAEFCLSNGGIFSRRMAAGAAHVSLQIEAFAVARWWGPPFDAPFSLSSFNSMDVCHWWITDTIVKLEEPPYSIIEHHHVLASLQHKSARKRKQTKKRVNTEMKSNAFAYRFLCYTPD